MTEPTMWRSLAALALAAAMSGCGALDVTDPIAIEDQDIRNATGAELTRRQVVFGLQRDFAWLASVSAEFTDEYVRSVRQWELDLGVWLGRTEADRRAQEFVYSASRFGNWHEVRLTATRAIEWLHAYVGPEAARNRIGQMYALRGYNVLALAEHFCPGFPLNEIDGQRIVYRPPLSTDELFEHTLADFDSAMVYSADTAQVLHLARIAKARALLGLGRFADAAATVTDVPTGFTAMLEYEGDNAWRNWLSSANPGRVSDQEGGNGIDFVSAADPRLQLIPEGMATDGTTPMYSAAKYENSDAPIIIASGIEARLIEAEAALNAGDPSWLTILNDLRRNHVTPALADTTDPGTFDAQVDLLFRERAFWLYATGHRLGDLRRLVAHYGRAAEDVFPTGAYRLGGTTYGPLTSLPFPVETESIGNPSVTGCTGP